MSSRRYRPRRRFRSELLNFAAILSLLWAVAGIFPREALFAHPSDGRPPSVEAGCAFVTLTEAQEAAALAAARTSWQEDARRPSASLEMLPQTLPPALPAPSVPLADGVGEWPVPRVAPSVRFLPPTDAAPPPQTIPSDANARPSAAFPRELMLQLDSSETKGNRHD